MNEPQQPTEEQLLDGPEADQDGGRGSCRRSPPWNLAGQKLSVEGAKDPAEARKAIDAAKQMLPLVPQDAVGPIQNALDQVQMLYAKESRGPGAAGGAAEAEDLDTRVVIGVFGGSGFYKFLDDMTKCRWQRRTAALRTGRIGRIDGTEVAFHASPRRRAHAAPAPHQLQGEHLGDEGGGRPCIVGPSAAAR